MKTITILFLALSLQSFSQEEIIIMDPEPIPEAPVVQIEDSMLVYEIVEEGPQFPGGDSTLLAWIKKNIRYPEIAKEEGVTAKTYVRFIVERDGSISSIRVMAVRTEKYEELFSKEAIRLVKSMPKFSPGKMRGKVVRCYYTIPVYFRLN